MLSGYFSLITHPDIQRFLSAHEHDDEKLLVLKKKEILGVPSSIIASQLIGRRKAKSKLPSWYKTNGIIYPPKINIEQCSSEATAVFKTSVINDAISSKGVAVDLTGGMGIDSYFLSKQFQSVHTIEPNPELLEITRHNLQLLGATNITYHCTTAENFLSQTITLFDLAYVDPSRRDEQSRRVHKLADCTPDITELQSTLLHKCPFILLKASPLLDIQQGLREIDRVKKVIVVSVGNECRELLFLAERNFEGEPLIEAVDLYESGSIKNAVSFTLPDARNATVVYSEPGQYLYEPNAAVLKSGAFKWIAERFDLKKLAVNTHLYTSTEVVPDFPGKVFHVDFLNPDINQIKDLLPNAQVNVVSRNYPLTADEIKKKYCLCDGGSMYLIGFSSTKRKHVALCSRITNI